MSEEHKTGLYTIKYKGIFDLDGLYRVMHDWLTRRGYQVDEKLFRDQPEEIGSYMHIQWEAWKKYTHYLKYTLVIEFKIWDAKKVDVVQNGVKKQLTRARMKITFRGDIETDYSHRWEKSKFAKYLADFHDKHIFSMELDTLYMDQIMYIAKKLVQVVKRYLNMSAYSTAYDDMW